MLVQVGVPTMTMGDLRQVLHELECQYEDDVLDDVPVSLRCEGLSVLRTVCVEENHSDFTDGREPHRIIVLSSELPY